MNSTAPQKPVSKKERSKLGLSPSTSDKISRVKAQYYRDLAAAYPHCPGCDKAVRVSLVCSVCGIPYCSGCWEGHQEEEDSKLTLDDIETFDLKHERGKISSEG